MINLREHDYTTGLDLGHGDRVRCLCGAAAVYVDPPDRFVHLDGSENYRCWVRLAKSFDLGAVAAEP